MQSFFYNFLVANLTSAIYICCQLYAWYPRSRSKFLYPQPYVVCPLVHNDCILFFHVIHSIFFSIIHETLFSYFSFLWSIKFLNRTLGSRKYTDYAALLFFLIYGSFTEILRSSVLRTFLQKFRCQTLCFIWPVDYLTSPLPSYTHLNSRCSFSFILCNLTSKSLSKSGKSAENDRVRFSWLIQFFPLKIWCFSNGESLLVQSFEKRWVFYIELYIAP